MKQNHLKWLILSQSSVFFAGSLIFPFYILFIKNIGSSYTQFGLSYGLFGLSGALIHPLLGRLSARLIPAGSLWRIHGAWRRFF